MRMGNAYRAILTTLRALPHQIATALELLWSASDKFTRWRLFLTLLFVVMASALAALAPVLLKFIIDLLTVEEIEKNFHYLLALMVTAYAGALWLAKCCAEFRGYFHGTSDQRLQRILSETVFTHIMALPLRFHLDRRSGALSQTLTNGLLGYRLILHHLVTSVLPALAEVAIMGSVLLIMGHSTMFLIVTLTVSAYVVAFSIGAARIVGPAQSASSAHIDATALLTDSVLNYEAVKSFNAENPVLHRFRSSLTKTEQHWLDLYTRKTRNGLVIATIFAASLGATIVLAVNDVIAGIMTVGDFVLVTAYVVQIIRPLELIGFAFRDFAQGLAFVERMANLLAQSTELHAPTSGLPMPNGNGNLKFDRVSLAYHANHRALKDVSFEVPSGHTLAVVGSSGSGKSSLVRLLLRLWEPASGRILLEGVPIDKLSLPELRRNIAVVPQDTILFNDSIAYNISIGRPDSTFEDVVKAAKIAGLDAFISQLPHGYSTTVGERGTKLSGGERQRIAIARAVIKRPRIFIFDEATSSLDLPSERAIQKNLLHISNHTTTILIAHRLSTVVHADEIIVMCRGRIVERGDHSFLMAQNGQYARFWQAQEPIETKRVS